MTCRLCQQQLPNAYKLGQHHKTEHPAEYAKKQREKKKREAQRALAAADPEPEPENLIEDAEVLALNDAIALFDRVAEDVDAARILAYLCSRYAPGWEMVKR